MGLSCRCGSGFPGMVGCRRAQAEKVELHALIVARAFYGGKCQGGGGRGRHGAVRLGIALRSGWGRYEVRVRLIDGGIVCGDAAEDSRPAAGRMREVDGGPGTTSPPTHRRAQVTCRQAAKSGCFSQGDHLVQTGLRGVFFPIQVGHQASMLACFSTSGASLR